MSQLRLDYDQFNAQLSAAESSAGYFKEARSVFAAFVTDTWGTVTEVSRLSADELEVSLQIDKVFTKVDATFQQLVAHLRETLAYLIEVDDRVAAQHADLNARIDAVQANASYKDPSLPIILQNAAISIADCIKGKK